MEQLSGCHAGCDGTEAEEGTQTEGGSVGKGGGWEGDSRLLAVNYNGSDWKPIAESTPTQTVRIPARFALQRS